MCMRVSCLSEKLSMFFGSGSIWRLKMETQQFASADMEYLDMQTF